jgi:hypothetical protein
MDSLCQPTSSLVHNTINHSSFENNFNKRTRSKLKKKNFELHYVSACSHESLYNTSLQYISLSQISPPVYKQALTTQVYNILSQMYLPFYRQASTTPVYVSISQMSLPVYRKASTTPVYVSISQMSLPVYRKASATPVYVSIS